MTDDLTRRPWRTEFTASLALAWPIAATQLATVALHATDTLMSGWLGAKELGALALASNLVFPCVHFGVGVLAALAAMFAQELGARNFKGVRRTARQGFWLVLTLFVPMGMFLGFGERFLLWTGQNPEVAALSGQYLRITLWSVLPMLTFIVLRNFIAAHSRPRAALVITCGGILLNAALDYVLMFGLFGFPGIGLMGAAVATVIVQTVMTGALLVYVLRDRKFRRYHLLVRFWRSDWPRYWDIVKVGTPIGLTVLAETTLFAAAGLMIGNIGTEELAGHAIALQFAGIAFMVPLGIAQAATIRVGLAYGAGDMARVGRAGWSNLLIVAIFLTGSASVFWLFGRPLATLFLDAGDPANAAAIGFATSYLAVAAIFQFADGGQVVALGALRGLKDTRVPMIIAVTSYWLIGAGVSWWLGFHAGWDGVGVWAGLAASLSVVATLLTIRFAMRERLGLIPGSAPTPMKAESHP